MSTLESRRVYVCMCFCVYFLGAILADLMLLLFFVFCVFYICHLWVINEIFIMEKFDEMKVIILLVIMLAMR